MSYRSMYTDPDFRREPRTKCWCVVCQRDITSTKPPLWVAYQLDKFLQIIHPADLEAARDQIRAERPEYSYPKDLIQFERIGSECARKLKGWTMNAAEHDAAVKLMQPWKDYDAWHNRLKDYPNPLPCPISGSSSQAGRAGEGATRSRPPSATPSKRQAAASGRTAQLT